MVYGLGEFLDKGLGMLGFTVWVVWEPHGALPLRTPKQNPLVCWSGSHSARQAETVDCWDAASYFGAYLVVPASPGLWSRHKSTQHATVLRTRRRHPRRRV